MLALLRQRALRHGALARPMSPRGRFSSLSREARLSTKPYSGVATFFRSRDGFSGSVPRPVALQRRVFRVQKWLVVASGCAFRAVVWRLTARPPVGGRWRYVLAWIRQRIVRCGALARPASSASVAARFREGSKSPGEVGWGVATFPRTRDSFFGSVPRPAPLGGQVFALEDGFEAASGRRSSRFGIDFEGDLVVLEVGSHPGVDPPAHLAVRDAPAPDPPVALQLTSGRR